MKIERMFSNVEEEKLYSTGNDELDNLLEHAFCEGYEYAQREFARRDYEGLTESQAGALRQQRAQLARKAKAARAKLNEAHSHESWTGNNSRVNFNYDLNGNAKHTKSTYARPLSLEEIKQQQRWDRKVQNADLLGEIKAEKENIREGVKKIGQPKELAKNNLGSRGAANEIMSKLNKKQIKPIKLSGKGKAVLGVGLGAAAIGTGMAIKNKKKKEENK